MTVPLQLFLCDDLAQAEMLNGLVATYLHEVDHSKCSRWSDIYVDYGKEPRYAILSHPILTEWSEDPSRSIVGEPLIRDDKGAFLSGNWEPLVEDAVP